MWGYFGWTTWEMLRIQTTQGMGPWSSKGVLTLEKYWNNFLYCSNLYVFIDKAIHKIGSFFHRRLLFSCKCLIKRRRKK